MRLNGKIAIAIATGGRAGIGAAASEPFASQDARLVVADGDGASRVAAGIGPAASAFTVDVRKSPEVRAMGAPTRKRFDGTGIPVNNAGAVSSAPWKRRPRRTGTISSRST